jgi:Tfp pilus assembly protein PilV
MPSTDRHRSQRGVSLVEAVVASALLGIGVVGGITAWDTATISAGKAVRQAWARCMVRSELNAILSAPWSGNASYPSSNSHVQTSAVLVRPDEQLVTVRANDPQSGELLYQASVLKAQALAGYKDMNVNGASNGVVTDVTYGCPEP